MNTRAAVLAVVAALTVATMAAPSAEAVVTGRINPISYLQHSNGVLHVTGIVSTTTQDLTLDGRLWKTVPVDAGHNWTTDVLVPVGTHTLCWTNLGCASFISERTAGQADIDAAALGIDRNNRVTFRRANLPAGVGGQSYPAENRIVMSAQTSIYFLHDWMQHEWAHELQYWAYDGNSWNGAVTAFNKAYGIPGSTSYDGIEHGADCMARIMGLTVGYQGYGCPDSLVPLSTNIVNGAHYTATGTQTNRRTR